MIEKLSGLPEGVAAFICHGKVTREDYQEVLVPEVERVLRGRDKVRVYYETGADFTGFDPGAMWEDAKLGMGHLSRWGRVAVVSDLAWIRNSVALFRVFMPGEVKAFAGVEREAAQAWIVAD